MAGSLSRSIGPGGWLVATLRLAGPHREGVWTTSTRSGEGSPVLRGLRSVLLRARRRTTAAQRGLVCRSLLGGRPVSTGGGAARDEFMTLQRGEARVSRLSAAFCGVFADLSSTSIGGGVTHPRALVTSARQVIDRVVIAAPTSRCDPVRGPMNGVRGWPRPHCLGSQAMRRPAARMEVAAPPPRRTGRGVRRRTAWRVAGTWRHRQAAGPDGRGQTGGREGDAALGSELVLDRGSQLPDVSAGCLGVDRVATPPHTSPRLTWVEARGGRGGTQGRGSSGVPT